jgi:hypothetical protein
MDNPNLIPSSVQKNSSKLCHFNKIACVAAKNAFTGVDLRRHSPYYPLTSAGLLLRERVAQLVEQLTFNQ